MEFRRYIQLSPCSHRTSDIDQAAGESRTIAGPLPPTDLQLNPHSQWLGPDWGPGEGRELRGWGHTQPKEDEVRRVQGWQVGRDCPGTQQALRVSHRACHLGLCEGESGRAGEGERAGWEERRGEGSAQLREDASLSCSVNLAVRWCQRCRLSARIPREVDKPHRRKRASEEVRNRGSKKTGRAARGIKEAGETPNL